MTKQKYSLTLLGGILLIMYLNKNSTNQFDDFYTILSWCTLIPTLIFAFKYYPKDKKELKQKAFIFLGFCVVLATLMAFFL